MSHNELDKISPGDIVFAKLRGFPWWPARIEDANTLPPEVLLRKEALEKQSCEMYAAFFYGSLDYGIFSRAKLQPFNVEKVKIDLERKKFTKGQIEAIEQALEPNFLDDYFSELKKFRENNSKNKRKATSSSRKKPINKKVSSQKSSTAKKDEVQIKKEEKEKEEIIQQGQSEKQNEAGIQKENELNDNKKAVNIRKKKSPPKTTKATTKTPTKASTSTSTSSPTTTESVNSRPKRIIKKKRYFDDIETNDDESNTDINNNSSTVDSPSITNGNKKSRRSRTKKLSVSLVEASNKSPIYERSLYRIYLIRLSIQHLAFKKKQGEILLSDYSKIDQVLKQIEQWSMTLDFLKDTKLYKVIHNISKYEFENDAATYKLRERCLKLLWDWKSNLIDPYLKEMNYESKATSLIDLPILDNVYNNP